MDRLLGQRSVQAYRLSRFYMRSMRVKSMERVRCNGLCKIDRYTSLQSSSGGAWSDDTVVALCLSIVGGRGIDCWR